MLQTINAKRIVVKVGSSTLTHETGKLNLKKIDELAKILSDLINQGKEVVLVSSGAVAVGKDKLNITGCVYSIAAKQAAAAVGQCELMYLYDRAFSSFHKTIAQILLSKDVVEVPHSKQNVINTFETLLTMGVIPIVNENDSVSYDEIEFGDNDTLSAVVATLVKADTLVLLSDIDGLYDMDPTNPNATLIPVVTTIDDHLRHMAGGSHSSVGTGGMVTKISAAEMAMENGIDMIIANGANPSILYDIFEGKDIGTIFLKKEEEHGKEQMK